MAPICSVSPMLHLGLLGFLPLSGQLSTPAAFSHTSWQHIVFIFLFIYIFLLDCSLPFDETCVVILSGCLSFSPSTIIFHLPTYHVHTGWEFGACRTKRWTNWRVDSMTDMVRNFFISPCRGCMFIFRLHVAMWIKTLFCKQWQRHLPWISGGFHSHCCWRNSTAANHCAYKERKHSVLTLGCYFYR